MRKIKQLRRWPLILAFSLLIGMSAATTVVLANNQTLTVTSSVLNVRLGPGLSYETMGQVQKGTSLTILQKQNSWYQVRLANNRVGWVASWLVHQDEATTNAAKVARLKTNANVRQYATNTAKQLGTLSAGTAVNVLYQQHGWSQIAYNNTAAWVASNLLETTGTTTNVSVAQTTIATAKTATPTLQATTMIAANIRSAAGLNAPVVTRVAKAAKLTVLNQSGDWYHVRTADNRTGYIASWILTMPGTTANKTATKLSEATIVLDPGHGGTDTGALSTSGKYEKTYTLQLAQAVGAKLQAAGANVIYTRSNDTFVDLAPRPVVAAKVHADAFISFHFDSTANANTASGFTTYYYNGTKDKALAAYVNKALGSNLTLTDRGVAFGNYEVLRDNDQPSILMEMGYINSDKDFRLISSAAYHQQVASDIVAGLNNYFQSGHHQ
ncbi:N-acetylmuramoyl-L-alanine amidase [Lacticaseibacillus baoqingensis]|uniref:N-acetylmuramoyl-L-alanine amidase n=1 Tax=Lacticaseibacillus baoqingensis TaxID=2486013 RepID=A0ABW4E960_9LACO|nr:N-acetylmuramoyl-L-alanine amidase [Lacticaseibacillus baoqingensis]